MKYKKPSVFNAITILLLLLLGAVAYVVINLWPVYALSTRVRGILLDELPMLYRDNLRAESDMRQRAFDLKTRLPIAMRQLGVKDPNIEIIIVRTKKTVGLEAHFTAQARFEALDKSFTFHLSPHAETDSERVDW